MAQEAANVVSIPGWVPNQQQPNWVPLSPIPDLRCMQIIVPLPLGGNETVVRVKNDGSYTVEVNAPSEET